MKNERNEGEDERRRSGGEEKRRGGGGVTRVEEREESHELEEKKERSDVAKWKKAAPPLFSPCPAKWTFLWGKLGKRGQLNNHHSPRMKSEPIQTHTILSHSYPG